MSWIRHCCQSRLHYDRIGEVEVVCRKSPRRGRQPIFGLERNVSLLLKTAKSFVATTGQPSLCEAVAEKTFQKQGCAVAVGLDATFPKHRGDATWSQE
jgi:hypothetical protein